MRVLVVGARKGSLGEAIHEEFLSNGHYAYAAGISGEYIKCDILDSGQRYAALMKTRPHLVVCTVGINTPVDKVWSPEAFSDALREEFMVNAVGPLELLREFIDRQGHGNQFVMVSSNSAHIARTGSLPYCASKAALSMGVRVAAREYKGTPLIWGVEPGFLYGTPMSNETAEAFAGGPLHRIPGLNSRDGLSVKDVAKTIVGLALEKPRHLNGVMLRMDGGEQ